MKACVYSDDPSSLKIAKNAMQQLEASFGPPNDVAFAMYLKALIKYSGSKEEVSELIKSCAKHGWISNHIVRELQKAGNILNDPLSLLENREVSWSRNVQEGDRPKLVSRQEGETRNSTAIDRERVSRDAFSRLTALR